MTTAPQSSGRGGAGRPLRLRQSLAHMRECLGWRLVMFLALSLLVLLGTSSALSLRLHRDQLRSQLESRAVETGELLLSATRFAMMRNDRDHLENIIEDVAASPRVLVLRLLDQKGGVSVSSQPGEHELHFALTASQCRPCHASDEAVAPQSVRDGLHFYPGTGDLTTLSLVVPVLNEPSCWQASCHVHGADEVLLGLLDIEIGTADLEAAIREDRVHMIALHAITLVVICIVVGVLTWRVVHLPFRELLDGTERFGAGALSHRLPEKRAGELGQLAASFNAMARRLEIARDELEEWNRSLETRVRHKTAELDRARDSMVFTEKMVSLGRLAAIVAHEINNPLAGILVSAKLARRRLAKLTASDVQQLQLDENLAMIERESARSGEIVKNLLLFSRSRELSIGEEHIETIVKRAVRLIQHQTDLQDIDLQIDIERDLPPVRCDANQIEQALLAVIINAMDAMPGGGLLRVSVTRQDADALRIEVQDSGAGIPEEIRMKIFEPFFTTKNEGQGTGLGLSVMYGIVQRHGGRVVVDSIVDKGTTVRIDLPLELELVRLDRTEGKESS